MSFDFDVKIFQKTVVTATTPPERPYVVPLTNLDLLSGRFPVTCLYVYPNPLDHSFTLIVNSFKNSLAEILNHYHPFAGRIVSNSRTNIPEIICDNHGALFVEAYVDILLKNLYFYDLNSYVQKLVLETVEEYPFNMQLTRFKCGGIAITFNFDHALGDDYTFGKFLVSFSEIARGKGSISSAPNHYRNLPARSPPIHNPHLNEIFTSYKTNDEIKFPRHDISLKRLYHIDSKHIERLRSLSGQSTKIEAFSAYIWKIIGRVIDESKHTHCKMGWTVDGRPRITEKWDSMTTYAGNLVSMAVGEARLLEDLRDDTLCNVAKIVHESIAKTTNEAHFLDLIDWVECNKPSLMLAKILLGQDGPGLVMAGVRRFPVVEVDFGFGPPVLGTISSTVEMIGAGYMHQGPSGNGDGSWLVSSILWPELVEALESDPDHVFQPLTTTHLRL